MGNTHTLGQLWHRLWQTIHIPPERADAAQGVPANLFCEFSSLHCRPLDFQINQHDSLDVALNLTGCGADDKQSLEVPITRTPSMDLFMPEGKS